MKLARLLLVVLLAAAGGCKRSRLPARGDGAAVVLVTPDAASAAAVPASAEVEPNDTTQTAQRLVMTGDAVAVTGTVGAAAGKARDADMFRVEIPNAGADALFRRRLALSLQPEQQLYASIDALDDVGHMLVSVSGAGAGQQVVLPNLAVTPGTYLVRVRAGGNSQGTYRLLFRLAPLEAGEEVEPNDKATLAAELQPGTEVAGYYGWKRDQDWYRVSASALGEGGVLSLSLEGVDGVSASLAAYDSASRRLTEQHGRKGERVVMRNLGLPGGEPFLYIVVRADAGTNVETRYRLEAKAEAAAASTEVEPNDDAKHATVITDGSWSAFMAVRDVDVFRYAPASPVELSVEATPPERVDLKLEILREDGRSLVKVDQGKRREPERVANVYVASPVLIRFTAARDDGSSDEPYRFTVSSRTPDPGAEREPNGTVATATPLAAGEVGTGIIFPKADVDYWQCTAQPDGEGSIPIAMTGIEGSTLELQVASQSGKELARMKVGPDTAPATLRVMPAGEPCCVLQVREPSGRVADLSDRYTLTVGVK